MSAIGEFELRARERRLRARLWRNFWVEQNVYDESEVPDVAEVCRDHAFHAAVESDHACMAEAKRLGFSGDPVWAYELMPETEKCRRVFSGRGVGR